MIFGQSGLKLCKFRWVIIHCNLVCYMLPQVFGFAEIFVMTKMLLIDYYSCLCLCYCGDMLEVLDNE